MRILLKRMPKNINQRKLTKFMTDMGITAFCNDSCVQCRRRRKRREPSEEKDECSEDGKEPKTVFDKRGSAACLFEQSTTI